MQKPFIDIDIDDLNSQYCSIQYAHRIAGYSANIGEYAPHIHVIAYHEDVKKIFVAAIANDILELSVPRGMRRSGVERFLSENEDEFLRAFSEVYANEVKKAGIRIEPLTCDSAVPFLGKELPIRILPDSDNAPYISEDAAYLPAGLSDTGIREAVLDCLGDKAYAFFKPRVERFAGLMKVEYSNLFIDDGRRGFGSYDKLNHEIFLSRRLMFMSEPVIDFLIVHELAHAEVFSHSKEHDSIMEQVLPNFDDLDEQFSDECETLLRRGWI